MYPQSWKSTLGVFYMTKISVKTKLKAVEEYANGNVALASVRHKYGIAEHDFQIWVGIYARFGKGPLLNPPKVTGDFRLGKVETRKFDVNFRNLYSLWISFPRFSVSVGMSL